MASPQRRLPASDESVQPLRRGRDRLLPGTPGSSFVIKGCSVASDKSDRTQPMFDKNGNLIVRLPEGMAKRLDANGAQEVDENGKAVWDRWPIVDENKDLYFAVKNGVTAAYYGDTLNTEQAQPDNNGFAPSSEPDPFTE